VDLPRVRRYRKGAIDRLYVEDAEGLTYGWADAATGEITIQIPGSEARVEAAFTAWANNYSADDLATHISGHSTKALAAAWQAAIEALDEDARTLEDMRKLATYQRDQYLKGNTGELRTGVSLNEFTSAAGACCTRSRFTTVAPTSTTCWSARAGCGPSTPSPTAHFQSKSPGTA
jgi:hypothetical protein